MIAASLHPQLTLSIPPSFLARLGWTSDTRVDVEIVGDALVLRAASVGNRHPVALEGNAAEVLALRLQAGLTRSELCLGLDLDLSTLTAWEEGAAQPDDTTLARVREALADPRGVRERAWSRQG